MPHPTITIYPNPGICPWQAEHLARALRARGARPLLVRVARRSIQVQAPEEAAGRLVAAARPLLGDPVYGPARPPEPESIEEVLHAVRLLSAEERYWEAHEAAEHAWRQGARQLHPLTLATAALALAQEGRLHPALHLTRHPKLQEDPHYNTLEQAVIDTTLCQGTPLILPR